MQNLRYPSGFWVVLAPILICPISLTADTVIISVTAPPTLSTLIDRNSVVSTSWSESKAYTSVTIAALVDSAAVGQTPTADAYLTTRIGPGTTATDEIAHARFTVPALLPVCAPSSCGAIVTLFSGLSLGPGDYFLTMGPDATSSDIAGWFPALTPFNPIVVEDTGVSDGATFFASIPASYAPASAFGPFPEEGTVAMIFTVTGTAATSTPEPATAALIGFGALYLVRSKRKAH